MSTLILKPFFLNNISELIYADPEFERLLFRSRGYDAMFRVMTVHSIDLP